MQIHNDTDKAEDAAEDRKAAKTEDASPAAPFDQETPFCTVTTPKVITCEMVSDLLVTAIEGGSTYWCTRVRPTIEEKVIDDPDRDDRVKRDGANWYAAAENFANPFFGIMVWYEVEEAKMISRQAMRQAFDIIGKGHPECLHRILNAGEADAEDADVWLQYAAFGELVYA